MTARITSPIGADSDIAEPTEEALGYRLDEAFEWMCTGATARSFVRREDGALIHVTCADGGTVRESRDEGATWTVIGHIAKGETGPGVPKKDMENGNLVQTPDGTLVWLYFDFSARKWHWNDETGEPLPDSKLPVWSARSADGGKTWTDRQCVSDVYCGAIIGAMVTSEGLIVAPIQRLLTDPGRHGQVTYVSADQGQTWRPSNVIDLGGHGHHDGAIEGTVTELSDGRLYMLLRTAWDRYWEAWSWNGGTQWLRVQPSRVAAISCPAFITRLASGRHVMIYNPLPEGVAPRALDAIWPEVDRAERTDWYAESRGPWTDGLSLQADGSWGGIRRPELAIQWSDDDCRTWSRPRIFARGPRVCYPQIREDRPGEMWISFVAGEQIPGEGMWARHLLRVREDDIVRI